MITSCFQTFTHSYHFCSCPMQNLYLSTNTHTNTTVAPFSSSSSTRCRVGDLQRVLLLLRYCKPVATELGYHFPPKKEKQISPSRLSTILFAFLAFLIVRNYTYICHTRKTTHLQQAQPPDVLLFHTSKIPPAKYRDWDWIPEPVPYALSAIVKSPPLFHTQSTTRSANVPKESYFPCDPIPGWFYTLFNALLTRTVRVYFSSNRRKKKERPQPSASRCWWTTKLNKKKTEIFWLTGGRSSIL